VDTCGLQPVVKVVAAAAASSELIASKSFTRDEVEAADAGVRTLMATISTSLDHGRNRFRSNKAGWASRGSHPDKDGSGIYIACFYKYTIIPSTADKDGCFRPQVRFVLILELRNHTLSATNHPSAFPKISIPAPNAAEDKQKTSFCLVRHYDILEMGDDNKTVRVVSGLSASTDCPSWGYIAVSDLEERMDVVHVRRLGGLWQYSLQRPDKGCILDPLNMKEVPRDAFLISKLRTANSVTLAKRSANRLASELSSLTIFDPLFTKASLMNELTALGVSYSKGKSKAALLLLLRSAIIKTFLKLDVGEFGASWQGDGVEEKKAD
jgi:hypothetical protein